MQPGSRIAEARRARGWTQGQLAERMGLTQQAIQRYEAGTRQLRAGTLERLAEALGVTVTYLLGLDDNRQAETDGDAFVEVPLLGPIAAGRPFDMEAADTTFPVPAEMRRRYPRAFLLRVEGESMNRVLPNGCYALVDPCDGVEFDGQPYAVRVGDLAATIKRVSRSPSGGLELAPDSTDAAFRPQAFDASDASAPEVAVIGRVVWHCIPYDWSY